MKQITPSLTPHCFAADVMRGGANDGPADAGAIAPICGHPHGLQTQSPCHRMPVNEAPEFVPGDGPALKRQMSTGGHPQQLLTCNMMTTDHMHHLRWLRCCDSTVVRYHNATPDVSVRWGECHVGCSVHSTLRGYI